MRLPRCWVRSLVFLLLVSLTVLPAAGCGLLGGDGEPGVNLDDVMDFGDEDDSGGDSSVSQSSGGGAAGPVATPLPAAGLVVQPPLLIEVRFLIEYQVNLEAMMQANRDLQSLLEYSNPADVDLEWVVDVHRETQESDVLLIRLAGFRPPGSQAERYRSYHVELLDGIAVMGIGSDRLLNAAVLVGPSGRTVLNLDIPNRGRFETLVRESRFYLSQAEEMIAKQQERVGDVIEGMAIQ